MFNLAKNIYRSFTQSEDEARANLEEQPYEQKEKVDQVLYFFEKEYDRYEGWLTPEEKEQFEKEQIAYYNAMNGVDFQNDQICHLIDELMELRRKRPISRDARIRVGHIKLDVGEAKTKRAKREKDRQACLIRLRPMISEVQTRRFLEEERLGRNAVPEEEMPKKGKEYEKLPTESTLEDGGQSQAPRQRKRRPRHYTDAEIASLLKDTEEL